jgi:hypothetical protein
MRRSENDVNDRSCDRHAKRSIALLGASIATVQQSIEKRQRARSMRGASQPPDGALTARRVRCQLHGRAAEGGRSAAPPAPAVGSAPSGEPFIEQPHSLRSRQGQDPRPSRDGNAHDVVLTPPGSLEVRTHRGAHSPRTSTKYCLRCPQGGARIVVARARIDRQVRHLDSASTPGLVACGSSWLGLSRDSSSECPAGDRRRSASPHETARGQHPCSGRGAVPQPAARDVGPSGHSHARSPWLR